MSITGRGIARSSSVLSSAQLATRICLASSQQAPLAAQRRAYASKRKAEKEPKESKVKHNPIVSTENLVPGSQRITAGEEYVKAEGKMKAVLERYRKDVASMDMRASGRVTPAILSPVRVILPENKDAGGRGVKLEEIATVGVREGTTLIVTVFEEHTLRYVEEALYDAKLPGVIPQKSDSRTIKIPMPKPTVETRHAMFAAAQRQAEEARVHIRKQHQASLKKGKYAKHSVELDEFQSLADKYLGEIDKVLAEVKKASGAK